jgi:hypothetical protein
MGPRLRGDDMEQDVRPPDFSLMVRSAVWRVSNRIALKTRVNVLMRPRASSFETPAAQAPLDEGEAVRA